MRLLEVYNLARNTILTSYIQSDLAIIIGDHPPNPISAAHRPIRPGSAELLLGTEAVDGPPGNIEPVDDVQSSDLNLDRPVFPPG